MKIIEKADLDAALEPHFSTPGFIVDLPTDNLTNYILKQSGLKGFVEYQQVNKSSHLATQLLEVKDAFHQLAKEQGALFQKGYLLTENETNNTFDIIFCDQSALIQNGFGNTIHHNKKSIMDVLDNGQFIQFVNATDKNLFEALVRHKTDAVINSLPLDKYIMNSDNVYMYKKESDGSYTLTIAK